MNIEEAKEQLISLKENAKVNIDTDEIFRLDYEAITFVLNELDKNTEIISDLQNEATIKDAEIERLKEYEHMYKDLCN